MFPSFSEQLNKLKKTLCDLQTGYDVPDQSAPYHTRRKVHTVFFLFPNVLNPPAPCECCLPHLAGRLIPAAVSAFALSWKQQCDRPWVGVRDELVQGYWGCGGSRILHQRLGAGSGLVSLDWSETEMADGVKRERGCFGTGEEELECV